MIIFSTKKFELKNKLKQFHLDTTNGEYKNTEQQENYETANSALEFVDEILPSNLPAGTQALVEVIHDQNTVLQELISRVQTHSNPITDERREA